MSKIHLGMVCSFGVKCGLATYTTYLSEALHKINIDVTVLAEHPFPDDSALDNSLKTNVPSFFCWHRNEGYDGVIKESKNYDILHIQHQFGLFPNQPSFVKLLHKVKIPIVTTLHDVVPFNPQFANYFNEIILNSKKIIVHTKPCHDLLLGWNCPEKKIATIPHGTKLIDVPSKSKAKKQLKLPKDSEVILSWGFIWESKGLLDLVKIHAELLKTHPRAILIHAGGVHPIIAGSKYLGKILKTAVKLGLTPKNFIITQWIPEDLVPIWFGTADVIVLNYMRGSASASGAAHRAMAAHRPIVGTDDLCILEIPKLTVPRFSVNDLYQGILKVLENKSLQKDLVRQADLASEEMSWKNVAKMHKNVYVKLT